MAQTDLLKALTGSATPGQYPDTVVGRLDAALAEAWLESTGLNIAVPASGESPGPYRSTGTDAWADIVDQATAPYGTAPKARTLTEKAALLEALVKGIDASKGVAVAPPVGTGTTLTGTLPAGTTQGTNQWRADLTKNDVISAGFKSTSWDTESGPSWPPPIGTYGGKRAIKFALGGGGKRIEVEPNHRTLSNGDDAWCGFSFYLESGFPVGVNDWQVIWQWHGNDTTSPQQCLQVRSGQLHIADNHAIGPQLVTGKWYRVVAHVQANSGGTMNVWLDDVNIASNYNAGLNATPLYLKCGLYRDTGISTAGTVYQADHALGTGYGAVVPPLA